MIVPFPESSLNDEAGKNFMDSYDEYAKRAKLLAGVHGLTQFSNCAPMMGGGGSSSAAHARGVVGDGKTPEESSDTDDHQPSHLDKKLDGKKSPTTLPNNAVDSGSTISCSSNGGGGGGGGGKKLKKSTHHSNIVRSGASSKTLEKQKSKKKSLKRL